MTSFNFWTEILKVLGFLGIFVCLAILGLKRFNTRGRPNSGTSGLSVIESLPLGGNRFVCVVRAGESRLLLGVTDRQISLIKDLGQYPRLTGETAAHEDLQETTSVSNQTSLNRTHPDKGSFLSCLSKELKKLSEKTSKRHYLLLLGLIGLGVSIPCRAVAAPEAVPIANIGVTIDGVAPSGGLATSLGILGMLTVLALAPSILIMTTSFTRIVIVFSFLRAGMGTQQSPPNQILVGLALLLTFFIMTPTWGTVNQVALAPYLQGQIDFREAFQRASVPLKEFMLKETREKDLALFVDLEGGEVVESSNDLSIFQVIPAFALSELKTAFEMGFLLFLPFLVVDMVVASTLMSMGMLMLPPVLISLPFKILLFVLVDGWGLITKSLIAGFR